MKIMKIMKIMKYDWSMTEIWLKYDWNMTEVCTASKYFDATRFVREFVAAFGSKAVGPTVGWPVNAGCHAVVQDLFQDINSENWKTVLETHIHRVWKCLKYHIAVLNTAPILDYTAPRPGENLAAQASEMLGTGRGKQLRHMLETVVVFLCTSSIVTWLRVYPHGLLSDWVTLLMYQESLLSSPASICRFGKGYPWGFANETLSTQTGDWSHPKSVSKGSSVTGGAAKLNWAAEIKRIDQYTVVLSSQNSCIIKI